MVFPGLLCNQSIYIAISPEDTRVAHLGTFAAGRIADRFLKSNRAPLDDKTSSSELVGVVILTRATVYPALSGRRVKWPVKGRRIEKKAGKRGRAIVASRLSNNSSSELSE